MANLTKLSEYVVQVKNVIQDNVLDAYMLNDDSLLQSFVRQAANAFSRKWPRRNSVSFAAVSQQYDYALATYLTNWTAGFSWIKSLEYPAGEQSPVMYKADRYTIYDQTYLRFLDGTPTDTSNIKAKKNICTMGLIQIRLRKNFLLNIPLVIRILLIYFS